MVNCVSLAYFYADVSEEEECTNSLGEHGCAKLSKAMHCTRMAAQRLQYELTAMLKVAGVSAGEEFRLRGRIRKPWVEHRGPWRRVGDMWYVRKLSQVRFRVMVCVSYVNEGD